MITAKYLAGARGCKWTLSMSRKTMELNNSTEASCYSVIRNQNLESGQNWVKAPQMLQPILDSFACHQPSEHWSQFRCISRLLHSRPCLELSEQQRFIDWHRDHRSNPIIRTRLRLTQHNASFCLHSSTCSTHERCPCLFSPCRSSTVTL